MKKDDKPRVEDCRKLPLRIKPPLLPTTLCPLPSSTPIHISPHPLFLYRHHSLSLGENERERGWGGVGIVVFAFFVEGRSPAKWSSGSGWGAVDGPLLVLRHQDLPPRPSRRRRRRRFLHPPCRKGDPHFALFLYKPIYLLHP
ncbi:hypothetical protein BHM03_00014066 [Ensete ventricosum]|uniref:Uncharacterized protein n=1 Tax=Ensete ventricosum TaxID=4639 RepID=A0A445ME11_ENSVE|nr:hypothetical protein BHM03_00014066 [Ensete ventricosum]